MRFIVARKVFKYPVHTTTNKFTLDLPFGAEIIHVAAQNGQFCMWALVEEENSPEPRDFYIHGTGQELPDVHPLKHLGSFFTDPQGTYVFHVFENAL